MEKRNRNILILSIIALVLLFTGLTYAYFSAMRFFINESHIIFKYKYAYHNSEILYEPYSEDYFKYHKNW